MQAGKITGELTGDDINEETIMLHATGLQTQRHADGVDRSPMKTKVRFCQICPDIRPDHSVSFFRLLPAPIFCILRISPISCASPPIPASSALGMTFVIISGGIDLSVGSMVALVGGIVILLLNYFGGDPMAITWAIMAGLCLGTDHRRASTDLSSPKEK